MMMRDQTSVKLGFRVKTTRKLNSRFFAMQALTAPLAGGLAKKRETACESGFFAPPGERGRETLRGPKSRVLGEDGGGNRKQSPVFLRGAAFALMAARG